MAPTLIHIHIPRTAGSTLNVVISESSPKHVQFLCALPEHEAALRAQTQEQRDRIDCVFSHYPYGLHRLFTRPVLYTASVREPRARIFSFWRFVLAREEHPLHAEVAVQGDDFSAFLRFAADHSAIRGEVDNRQVRMLSGHMEMGAGHDDHLTAALGNIAAGNFELGVMDSVAGLLARIAHHLGIEIVQVPRLKARASDAAFAAALGTLAPDARELLDRFVSHDTILYAVARDTVAGPLLRDAAAARRAAAAATPSSAGAPAAAPDVAAFVRGLYRALLLREPDEAGFADYVAEMGEGLTCEDAIRRMLRSQEFAGKQREFADAYRIVPYGTT